MNNLDGALLKDYRPVSELVTPAHRAAKPSCPVIDMHTHFGAKYRNEFFEKRYSAKTACAQLRQKGVCRAADLSIFSGSPYDRKKKKTKRIDHFLYRFAPIDFSSLGKKDFEQDIRRQFGQFDREQIFGIKIWKNLTLQMQVGGAHVFLADPRLSVIWEEAAARGWPVTVHAADPPAFFKEPNGSNERMEELLAMPKWCYAQDPALSFQGLMEQQERLLQENKKTVFIIAHMGSWPSNLRQVGRWMEQYPNMYVDTAACLSELGRQPYTSASFFEKHQDRILFGTDYFAGEGQCYEIWYRFLETKDEYFPHNPQNPSWGGRWNIYGIQLGKEVLEKVYYKNAAKILKLGRKGEWDGAGD